MWYDERMDRMLHDLHAWYLRAGKRLLLLDYDGTLREFELQPEQAVPTPEIKQLLQQLASDDKNVVVIVSGRDHETLEHWFGGLPVYFVAEHGMAYRAPSEEWRFADALPAAWQESVRKLMDTSTQQVPGSLVETKSNSLAWHYRKADEATVMPVLAKLLDKLEGLATELGLRILRGSKVVEVQPLGIDKGSSVRRWFDLDDYDFVLAVGDDVTDEDLFLAMPEHAATVKIGEGETAAKHRLPDPPAARALLTKLALNG
mgnify:CR=1 FL=1|jgi:trehalose-phosphatase